MNDRKPFNERCKGMIPAEKERMIEESSKAVRATFPDTDIAEVEAHLRDETTQEHAELHDETVLKVYLGMLAQEIDALHARIDELETK